MRDYRDAKIMAQTLRGAFAEKHCRITISESLELVARLFGVRDWNTLSAFIKNSGSEPRPTRPRGQMGGTSFALTTEAALHRALEAAAERAHSEATVEHLLLSLTYDPDAIAILKACAADPAAIRDLLSHSLGIGKPSRESSALEDCGPSLAFQRVVQRAILNVQASGGGSVTGAHLLAAILSEVDTPSVRILGELGVERGEVLRLIAGWTG